MCVTVRVRTMGCGKSRHRSPEDSEVDLKNSSKNSSAHNAKKRKLGSEEKKTVEGEKEVSERSNSFKKISNGKSSKVKERNEEIGVPLSDSQKTASGAAATGSSDKSNGATKTQNKTYLLEVPNEISKPESQTKSSMRDFKSMTASKIIHVTSSQIEFFKMLDEKIEKGAEAEFLPSGEGSEVSSVDDVYRY
ncbi:unnamed protein product [Lymnaea stagnalis]|uniref:Uncharacterized protein n=1 Tax=Lymnaea stagnalis TaxID=6523 RepID=A0AAV2IJQ7_LYMST